MYIGYEFLHRSRFAIFERLHWGSFVNLSPRSNFDPSHNTAQRSYYCLTLHTWQCLSPLPGLWLERTVLTQNIDDRRYGPVGYPLFSKQLQRSHEIRSWAMAWNERYAEDNPGVFHPFSLGVRGCLGRCVHPVPFRFVSIRGWITNRILHTLRSVTS